jgi:hypothetical protein
MKFSCAVIFLWGCSASSSAPATPDAPRAAADGPLVVDGPGASVDAAGHPDARSTDAPAAPADAAVTPADAPTTACAPCPTGYTCGSANGLAVCRNDATGIPLFTQVTVIVMENLSLSELMESDNVTISPYMQSLMANTAYGTDYHGVTHPSLPNYMAITSGDDHGVGCDCTPGGDRACSDTLAVCTTLFHNCSCPEDTDHIGRQLERAGRSWRAYGESMGRDTPCRVDTDSLYASRHVPFVYYADLQADAQKCAAHVVDLSYLAEETTVPDFAFIAPNLTNDMHNPIVGHTTNIKNGDAWLGGQSGVQAITGLDGYKKGGLLVIVWDEDDYSGLLADDDPIPIFVLSPYAKTGYVSGVHADHYSLLATIEDGLGLDRIGKAAAATPLSDYFPDQ